VAPAPRPAPPGAHAPTTFLSRLAVRQAPARALNLSGGGGARASHLWLWVRRGAAAVTRESGGPRHGRTQLRHRRTHPNHRRFTFSPTFGGARASRGWLLVRRCGVARLLTPEGAAGSGGVCTQPQHRRYMPITGVAPFAPLIAARAPRVCGCGARLPFSTGLWLREQQPPPGPAVTAAAKGSKDAASTEAAAAAQLAPAISTPVGTTANHSSAGSWGSGISHGDATYAAATIYDVACCVKRTAI
jgi:hypothetical protein